MKRNWMFGLGLTLTWVGVTVAVAQEPPPSKPAGSTPPGTPPTNVVPAQQPAAPTVQTQFKPGEAPKLVLGAKEWDFGTKWYGEKCETEVTIKNEGNFDLTIVNIRTSCGCTLAKPKSGGQWNNKVLKPGESDSMQLSYNTKKAATKVSQTITIDSNDPSTPSYAFIVKGEVRHICKMEPGDRITFGRVERDQAATQGITLTSQTDKPMDLKLDPLPDTAKFSAELKTDEPGKKWTLTVATKPPLDLGPNSVDVKITTGNSEMPTITIPVNSYIAPRVSVSPAKVFVSSKITQPFQRVVRVSYPTNKPIKVLSATPSTDKIKAEIVQPTAPPAANAQMAFTEIKLNLPAGSEVPNGAKVEIATDDPSPEYAKLIVDIVSRDDAAQAKPAGAGTVPSPVAKPTATPVPAPGEKKPEEKKDKP
jgi:hypothetical protein